MRSRFLSLATALLLLALGQSAQADLVRLANGGMLRGRLDGGSALKGARVTIETLSGLVVTIDRRFVKSISQRRYVIELYETRAKTTPDTVDAQWELAQWCTQNRLFDERAVHLERILELDSDCRQAHELLDHVQVKGVWMTRHEAQLRKGYQLYKGRYVSQQEFEVLQERELLRDVERQWYKKIRQWRQWALGNSNPNRRAEAIENLNRIDDPNAVPALVRLFSDQQDDEQRRLYVSMLGRIGGDEIVGPLVRQALFDSSHSIRRMALDAIPEDRRGIAVAYLIRSLHHDYNLIVKRAAGALEEFGHQGNEGVVPALIDALVTSHAYRVRVPDNSNAVSFNTSGSFANPADGILPPEIERMLLAGQLPLGVIVLQPQQPVRTKVITVRYSHNNTEALAALKKLTGESFGYDKQAWKLWLSRQKTAAALKSAASP